MPTRPIHRIPVLASVGLLLLTPPVAAQITLIDGDDARLAVSGYTRTLTAVHDRGYDLPDLPGVPDADRVSGLHSQVVRVKWQLEGAGWRVDVHDRLQARLQGGAGEGVVLGFGVSAVPDRLIDLETDLVSQPGLRVWHDVDRLSLSVETGPADLTLGRQAITWGVSGIFPVADLWARFSPFELDTEEKPGIDAVRALFYPVDGLEMDLVVAHRGALEDLSAGLRGTYSLASADLWAGAGKLWRQGMLMGGATLLLDQARLRAEAVLPWELDTGSLLDPRATLGIDFIRGTTVLTGEYHFNGIGAGETAGYNRVIQDPRFGRGETYYLGRHYLGAVGSWSPDEENRLTLALNALANLQDGSVALTPIAGYDLGQATRLSLGGLLSFGATPRFDDAVPAWGSEFGSYGDLLFTRISVFF